MIVAMPAASAQTAEAGASGSCFDSDGSGGEDDLRVIVDAGSGTVTVDPLTATGTVAAVGALVLPPNNPPTDNCTADDPPNDYIEVHVFTDAGGVQVCYDGFEGGTPTGPCETNPDNDGTITVP